MMEESCVTISYKVKVTQSRGSRNSGWDVAQMVLKERITLTVTNHIIFIRSKHL